MSPESEPYRDEEDEEYAPQSIFAAGWFRAVLVLTVLAIVVVVSLPYLLNWFEPTPPPLAQRPSAPPATPAPAAPSSAPPVAEPRPAEPKAAPQVAEPKAAEPKPAEAKVEPKVAEKPSGDKGPAPVGAAAEKPARLVTPKQPDGTPKAEPKAVAALPKAADSKPAAAGAGKPPRAEGRGSYWLQLGLFKEQANAELLAKTVREQGFTVEVTQIAKSDGGGLPPGTYHLVRAGGFPDRAAAGKAREVLGAKGHQGFVTRSTTP